MNRTRSSGTVTTLAEGRATIELYCRTTDEVFTSVDVPAGPVCLTGVIDLPAGVHVLGLRLRADDYEGAGSFRNASFQIITGQTVTERGCIPEDGGGCG